MPVNLWHGIMVRTYLVGVARNNEMNDVAKDRVLYFFVQIRKQNIVGVPKNHRYLEYV